MSGPTSGLSRAAVTGAPARERHFVTFGLDRWEFAVEVAEVCGIYHGLAIIPTPDDSEATAGEVNLCGRRVPVVDLRHRLRLPVLGASPWLLAVGQGTNVVALIVDSVTEVIRVAPRAIETGHGASAPARPLPFHVSAVVRHRGRTVFVPDWTRLLPRMGVA